MEKATTIRMTKDEKDIMQLHTAARGLQEVQQAIVAEFNRQHADFDGNAEFDGNWPNKTLKKGLTMQRFSIRRGTLPQVEAKFDWTPEYVKKQTEIAEEQNRRPYLYSAGQYRPINPQITDEDGKPVKHDDGTDKYRWEWTPHIVAGIETYMENCMKAALAATKRDLTEQEVKYSRDGRVQEVWNVVQRLQQFQAYITLDKTYYENGGRSLVSKRASPYEHQHYVLRGDGSNPSDSDYYIHPLLGLGLKWSLISKGKKILQALQNMHTAYNTYNNKQRNRKYTQTNVEAYVKNVEMNEQAYEALIKRHTNWGTEDEITIEDAIKADNAKRAEVEEYFKNMPHADMLSTGTRTPAFCRLSISEQVKQAENRIVQSKATLAREQTRLTEETSDLPKLEWQITMMEAEKVAAQYGLLNDGGEEE
ncbi:MAG: hypothetical protein Unbinned2404contig1000_74 [Prokaryotic dsDNA virus sp.]|nr:MAG: hypothetical protein Unbinned2404contig1000_74 [Prokaryotic dsDNA virus sp.]|tara:strand:+ start:13617 stop:14879 length:1263 start_codon:yes stop_codon:yes gene_type:complete